MSSVSPKLAKRNVTPQKVVSFKAFEAKEKCKIQVAYPFLSPEQIKGKIKDRWNKLNDEEKQSYTTYKLERTPQRKKDKLLTKESTTLKRKSLSNLNPPKLKEQKLDEGITTEHVNTKQLKITRFLRQETYENGFSETCESKWGSLSPSPFTVDKTRTYQNQMKHRTPDRKKENTQGILKNSDSAKKLQKSRVSFNSPMEVNTYNLDAERDQINRSDVYDDIEFNDIQDSDEDDSYLIRREDNESGEIIDNKVVDDETEGDMRNVEEPEISENMNSDDFKGIEDQGSGISYETDSVDMTESRQEVDFEIKTQKSDENVGIQTRRSLPRSKKGSKRGCDENKEEIIFKSPLLSSGQSSTKKKTRDVRKKTPDLSKVKDQKSAQITPLIPHNKENPDDYTTPQMDEILQQFTLDEVVKAPQKLRQNREDVNESQRMQAQIVGRHVNRSLLSPDKIKSAPERKGKTEKADLRIKVGSVNSNEIPEKQSKQTKTKPAFLKATRNEKHSSKAEYVKRVKEGTEHSIKEKKTDIFKTCDRKSKLKRNASDKNSNTVKASPTVNKVSRRSSNTGRDSRKIDNTDNMDTETPTNYPRPVFNTTNQANIDYNNNNNYNDDLNISDMNPSGDAGGSYIACLNDFSIQAVVENIDDPKCGGDKCQSRLNDKVLKRRSMNKLPKGSNTSVKYVQSSPYCSSSSYGGSSSGAEASSENSPSCLNVRAIQGVKKKTGHKTANNPVLEKALKLLQLTTANSVDPDSMVKCEEEECLVMDTAMSPGLLLSPALSGVSEFSSGSSSLSGFSQDAMFSHKSSVGNGLSQLFNDLTPPEQRTKGLFKTKRSLKSSANHRNGNTKEFFNCEDADIFS